MDGRSNRSVIIIVAHPDDEILWVGGTILNNPIGTISLLVFVEKMMKTVPLNFINFYKF